MPITPTVFVIEIDDSVDPTDYMLACVRAMAITQLPAGSHVVVLPSSMTIRQIGPDAPKQGAMVHLHGGIYVDTHRVENICVTVDLSVRVAILEGKEAKAYLFRAETDGPESAMKLASEIMERVNAGRFLTMKIDGTEVPVSVADHMKCDKTRSKAKAKRRCENSGRPSAIQALRCMCEHCQKDLVEDIRCGAISKEEVLPYLAIEDSKIIREALAAGPVQYSEPDLSVNQSRWKSTNPPAEMTATLEEQRSIPCPVCGAPAGHVCEVDCFSDLAAKMQATQDPSPWTAGPALEVGDEIEINGERKIITSSGTCGVMGTSLGSPMLVSQGPTAMDVSASQNREMGYGRFTDRARRVMQLANQEAQRFNHEYIGTEHVLLGLVKEGGGVAANVLKNRGLDLRSIRLAVEKIVQAGPDMITMGKFPQTPNVKKAVEFAMEEAIKLGHNYVGTEHLLLGLIRLERGVAFDVLNNLGVSLDVIRESVMMLLKPRELPHADPNAGGSVVPNSLSWIDEMPGSHLPTPETMEVQRNSKAVLQPKEGPFTFTLPPGVTREDVKGEDGKVASIILRNTTKQSISGSINGMVNQMILISPDESLTVDMRMQNSTLTLVRAAYVEVDDGDAPVDPRPLCTCTTAQIAAGGCECGGR